MHGQSCAFYGAAERAPRDEERIDRSVKVTDKNNVKNPRPSMLPITELVLVLFTVCVSKVIARAYDPLATAQKTAPAHIDLTVHDAKRNRDIPLRVDLPTTNAPAPVVLFSHGLGGSRAGSAFLGEHWASRGYVAVFVQHPGSDDSVWKNEATDNRMAALKKAASLDNFLLRVQDIPAVLNQIEVWNAEKGHQLAGRLDLKKVGMSGHSFGAVTTEAVSGESTPLGGQKYTDQRIKAAVVFSPSAPRGGSAAKAFGDVKIPWLLMTGTKDLSPIGEADMNSRLAVYPALHGASKYEVVLDNAEHSVFTDRPLPGDHEPRNPNHHRVILALSTAFWDAYLRGDAEALAWLNGAGPRSVMESADKWQLEPH
jgi:predicted dienelactone hydrolase